MGALMAARQAFGGRPLFGPQNFFHALLVLVAISTFAKV